MIGPSAPKGPPVPIAMAADTGLRTATLGMNSAPVLQHGLHRFRYAVPLDLLGTVLRHEPDDQTAERGYHDDGEAQRISLQGRDLPRQPTEEHEPADDGDGAQQRECDEAGGDPDDCREQGDANEEEATGGALAPRSTSGEGATWKEHRPPRREGLATPWRTHICASKSRRLHDFRCIGHRVFPHVALRVPVARSRRTRCCIPASWSSCRNVSDNHANSAWALPCRATASQRPRSWRTRAGARIGSFERRSVVVSLQGSGCRYASPSRTLDEDGQGTLRSRGKGSFPLAVQRGVASAKASRRFGICRSAVP